MARPKAEDASAAGVEAPEAWVQRILTLRKEGKRKEAEEELAKFKRRYPDYSLPEELKSNR
jgi:hypothetical protein